MAAVDAELTAGGLGGPLAAESLANVLAVRLIRHLSAPRPLKRGRDGVLSQGRLHRVVEYIEEVSVRRNTLVCGTDRFGQH